MEFMRLKYCLLKLEADLPFKIARIVYIPDIGNMKAFLRLTMIIRILILDPLVI